MAKISSELQNQLSEGLNTNFDLIVRVQGDVTQHLEWFASAGITVTQQFRLSPGVAVTCTGATAQKMVTQDLVISIELDKPVTTMGG